MENTQIDDVARLLKSIAHPIRLKILCLLQDGELSVGDLLTAVQTTNGNLSQHLAILRHQGIIVSHKEANFIYNRIADPRILSLMRGMQSLFCNHAAANGAAEPDLARFSLIEPPESHSGHGD